MIKKYRISVDGKSYEVEVQDLGPGSSGTVQNIPFITQPAAEASTGVSQPAAAAVPDKVPAKPEAAPLDVKGEVLRAPMPGTILSVTATAGMAVKRGDVLLILEAMKMENEIVAHIDGTIAAVYVQKGASINAGEIMVSFA